LERKKITLVYKNIVLYIRTLLGNVGITVRLIISVLVGILAACLIFTAVVFSAQQKLELPLYYTPPLSNALPSPVEVKMFISNLSEPVGIGSEADITIIATSSANLSEAVIEIQVVKAFPDWPAMGIEVVGGDLQWTGNLTAQVSALTRIRIKATEVGFAKICAYVTWPNYGRYSATVAKLGILAQENEVQIIQPDGGDIPHVYPPDKYPPGWIPPNWPKPPPDNSTESR